MDHLAYKEQLSALLDGELNDAEREDALAHLADCADCRAYFAELTALHDALGDLDEIDVPDGFAEGVMARLHTEAAPQRAKKRRPWRGMAALAACAAVALLAIRSLPRMGSGGGSAPMTASSSAAVAPAAYEAAAEVTAEAAPEETEALLETQMLYTGSGAEAPEATANDALTESKAIVGSSFDTTTATLTNDAGSGAPGAEAPAEPTEPAPPELTLMGEGAAEWLAEHAEPLGGGRWRVNVDAVNELPDTLALVAVDGIQEPVDGTLVITFGTAENSR